MKTVRKVIAFCKGDSRQCSTWSNVPYFFLEHLEDKGITVVRVNTQLEDDSAIAKKLVKCANAFIRHTYRLFRKDSTAMNTVERSRFYEWIEKQKIEDAVKNNSDADVALFFDYSHSLKKSNTLKVILFCDWTIEYEIENHQNRKPNYWERKAIERQYSHMEQADCIITLFPNVYKELLRRFGNEKVHYLGNVINAETDKNACDASTVERHFASNRVLMIGRKAYKSGFIQLARAVKSYNEGKSIQDQLHIDVIGMTEKETGLSDSHITYYGYLNKNDSEQKRIYYNLIKNAKLMCNTTENWIGASSIIEAMYWSLPVIINPTEDIYKTFGKDIEFGKYVLHNDAIEINAALKWLFNLDKDAYSHLCEAAHNAVKDFTWEGYTDRVIKTMENL